MFTADVALPDLSRPPPNFNNTNSTPSIPPLMSLPPPDFLPDDLLPSLPYYDLPAGLMVPLVKVVLLEIIYFTRQLCSERIFYLPVGRFGIQTVKPGRY